MIDITSRGAIFTINMVMLITIEYFQPRVNIPLFEQVGKGFYRLAECIDPSFWETM